MPITVTMIDAAFTSAGLKVAGDSVPLPDDEARNLISARKARSNTVVNAGAPSAWLAAELAALGREVDMRDWNGLSVDGTNDNAAIFSQIAQQADAGSQIIIPRGVLATSAGFGTLRKRISIKGDGHASRIKWVPSVSQAILIDLNGVGAPASEVTDEAQLDGPVLRDFRIISDRSIRAHAIKAMRVDNLSIQNVFVSGVRGRALWLERSREWHVNGFRTRFNGYIDPNAANCQGDVLFNSSEGTGDTTNFCYFNNVALIYSFWNELDLRDCVEMNYTNLMVHHFPQANVAVEAAYCSMVEGTAGFGAGGVANNQYAALHSSPGGVAANVSGRTWLTPFLASKPVQAVRSTRVHLGFGRLLGGQTACAVHADDQSDMKLTNVDASAAESSQYASAFTFVADTLTVAATCRATGTPVVLTTTGTLPTGLSERTTYYVIKLSSTTCKLASTAENALNGIAITPSGGTGTHTLTSRTGYVLLATGSSRITVDRACKLDNGFQAALADDSSLILGMAAQEETTSLAFANGPDAQSNEGETLLFVLRNADMNSTADQKLRKVYSGKRYFVTRVIARQKTANSSGAAVGGIYTAAAKAGSQIVGASQAYTALSGQNTATELTRTAFATGNATAFGADNASSLFLSLTTASGVAGTFADVFVFGVVLD